MQYAFAFNQRWRDRRSSYRPATEPIRPAEFDVAEIVDDTTARAFVTTHHYSQTYPAARFRVGLYRHGELVGVAVFSHPCSDAVLTNVFPLPALTAIELGRFVLLDAVGGNGETWFLARCFALLKTKGIRGVVSFSDPLQRRNVAGELVHMGHVGTIYQSHNGIYLGRGTPRTLRLLPDGRVFSDRAAQKIRTGERGWKYAAAQLEAFGAKEVPTDDTEARAHWLAASLAILTTKLRHRGNHKYAWPLDSAIRRELPASLPYPKILDTAA
jgi:hypothetical protein